MTLLIFCRSVDQSKGLRIIKLRAIIHLASDKISTRSKGTLVPFSWKWSKIVIIVTDENSPSVTKRDHKTFELYRLSPFLLASYLNLAHTTCSYIQKIPKKETALRNDALISSDLFWKKNSSYVFENFSNFQFRINRRNFKKKKY